IQDISARHGILVATYGHIGGGGLHPGLLIDGHNADEIQRALRVADDIHQLALRLGGTVTGEHGVGAARAPYMAQEHGPALEVMHRLKRALDPNGIMNPGVIFDTPALLFEMPQRASRRTRRSADRPWLVPNLSARSSADKPA